MERLNEALLVRMSSRMKRRVERVADERNVSEAAWVREVIEKALRGAVRVS